MADRPVMRVCWQMQPRTFDVPSDEDARRSYTVYFGYAAGQLPTCTCLGFQVVKPDADGIKRCKHIRRVEHLRCTYTEDLDGPARPSLRCPKCGGHTVEVYRAS